MGDSFVVALVGNNLPMVAAMITVLFLAAPALSLGDSKSPYRGMKAGIRVENQTDLLIKLKQSEEHLQDYRVNGIRQNGVCNKDMRPNIPVTCQQSCSFWCWAAGISMVVSYYKGYGNCLNDECTLASYVSGQQCCPWSYSCSGSASDKTSACNIPAGWSQQQWVLQYILPDKTFGFGPHGSLLQADLDNVLNSGRPVLIGVHYADGGDHELIIGGCGNGVYYVHDPWKWYTTQHWQQLSYPQLMTYTNGYGDPATWTASLYLVSSDEEKQAMIV